MKKISNAMMSLLTLLAVWGKILVADASEMSSKVGINFEASPKSPIKSALKELPSTGELVQFSTYFVGLLLLFLAIYLMYRKYQESRNDA